MIAALLTLHALAADRTVAPDDVVRRRERVDPGEELSDFDPGDVDLRLQLGFTGSGYGPQTLLTAFFNWFEVQGAVDLGVARFGETTLGLGVEATLGRPWLPESVAPLASARGADLSWRAASRAVLARATLHYTGLSALDPYLVAFAGPGSDTVRGFDPDSGAVGRYRSGALRLGAGGGVDIVTRDRVTGGLELRYLGTARFAKGVDVPVIDRAGDTIDTFTLGRAQRPPGGFSWVVSIGVRL